MIWSFFCWQYFGFGWIWDDVPPKKVDHFYRLPLAVYSRHTEDSTCGSHSTEIHGGVTSHRTHSEWVYYAANWNGVIGLQRLNPNHSDASINHTNTIYTVIYIYILYHIYHLWVYVHHLQILIMPVFFFHPWRPSRCFSELPASAGGPNLALGSMGTGLNLGRRKVIWRWPKNNRSYPIYRSKNEHVWRGDKLEIWKFDVTCSTHGENNTGVMILSCWWLNRSSIFQKICKSGKNGCIFPKLKGVKIKQYLKPPPS